MLETEMRECIYTTNILNFVYLKLSTCISKKNFMKCMHSHYCEE
jgi:hypothetical protein